MGMGGIEACVAGHPCGKLLGEIPKVMGTGLFTSVKLYRLINDPDSADSTYSIQFFSDELQNIQKFLQDDAPLLAAEHQHRFQHKHVAFRTVLQEEKL